MPKKKNKAHACPNCTEIFKNGALFLARLIVGAIFIKMSMNKLMDINAFAGMLESANWFYPTAFAWLAAITELVGGFALVLGLFTEVGAALLTGVMIVAILTMHMNLFTSPEGYQSALPAISLLAANLSLMVSGGGRWALTSLVCDKK